VGTAVLAGALIVGDSVRGSLKEMALQRLGKVTAAIASGDRLFRSKLAEDISKAGGIETAAGLQLIGTAVNPESSARANKVQIIGVDKNFWELANNPPQGELADNTVWLNSRLAEQLRVKTGETVLLRVPKTSQLSRDAPLAPEEDSAVALRLEVAKILADAEFGRFSLQANQIPPFNAFVNLGALQKRIGATNQANLLLVTGSASQQSTLSKTMRLADAQLELREITNQNEFELRTSRVFLDDFAGRAALQASTNAQPIFTYFVNELRVKDRAAPYSMATAAGPPITPRDLKDDEIVINQWLADDLHAKPGEELRLSYFVVGLDRELVEQTNTFRIHSIVAMDSPAADRTLMPDFPGMTTAENCRDWDTGFPIKTDRIRDKDETYWHQYRGTPKAFVTLATGQKMWSNRFGNLTAVRYPASQQKETLASNILARIKPEEIGLQFQPVREQALAASSQTQDFGGLFIGFSFFLIVAALVLMSLLFRFGLEQRGVEIGTLLALGFTPKQVRKNLLLEGAAIALFASIVGLFGGILYAKGMLWALSTIWRQAIASASLNYFASAQTLAISAAAGILIAVFTIWWSLRKEGGRPARELLAEGLQERAFTGEVISDHRMGCRRFLRAEWIAIICGVLGVATVLWGLVEKEKATADLFFSAGALILIAGLAGASWVIRKLGGTETASKLSVSAMGIRGVTRRSSRSRATIGLLACGSFLIASIGAFHLDAGKEARERSSGTGGFALIGESALPVLRNLNTPAGREAAGLDSKTPIQFVSFRIKEGEDASCLNLNRAQRPRLLGVNPQELASRKAFSFSAALDKNEKSPWLLLNKDFGPGIVSAIGDAASIQWALGKKLGDDLIYVDERGQQVKVRIVGAVENSTLQGSLIISEQNFVKLFPSEAGYRFFLIDAPQAQAQQIASELSKHFQDTGMEITSTTERLAAFNAVQNTYLNTFQILGGLGLLLGTAGLGVVLLRNVFERRGELALLLAIGFRRRTLKWLILSEHAGLLAAGILIGIAAAAVAVLPALLHRGAGLPYRMLSICFAAIILAGLLSTLVAAAIALKGRLLDSLRAE
jgi:putative ABC transport system permease protein